MDTSRDSVDKKVSRDFAAKSRDRLKETKKIFFFALINFFSTLYYRQSLAPTFFASIFFLYFVEKRGYRPFEIPRLSSRVKKCTERKRYHLRKKSKVPTWRKKENAKKFSRAVGANCKQLLFFCCHLTRLICDDGYTIRATIKLKCF